MPRVRPARLIPLDDDLPPLARRQQRQVGQSGVGSVEDAFEQLSVMRDHALDGRFVEEVRAVDEAAAQTLGGFPEVALDVEPRRAAADIERTHLKPAQGEVFRRRVLQGERHLKQRVAAHVAARVQLLDEFFKRQVLMRVSAERRLFDSPQKLAEGRVAREVCAQDEHVDEEADERLKLRARAARDRRPDDDVGLPRVAIE